MTSQSGPWAGGGERAADERPGQRRRHPHHREQRDDSRHEAVREEAILGDVDERDERAAAEPLRGAPGEQHRHRRRRGADDAARGVEERRYQHGAAQAVPRHTCADRRRGHDRARQVQGERPAYEPQAADVADRFEQRRCRQHGVGGVQPDREAQHQEPRQVLARQDLAPADVVRARRLRRGPQCAFSHDDSPWWRWCVEPASAAMPRLQVVLKSSSWPLDNAGNSPSRSARSPAERVSPRRRCDSTRTDRMS